MLDCYKKKLPTNQDSALRTATATLGNLFQSTRPTFDEIIPLISIIIINSRPLINCLSKKPVVADTSTRDSHLKRLLHSHSALVRENHFWFSKVFLLSLIPWKE